jgi:hypothetical protein
MLRRSKKCLHAASAKANMCSAGALRRPAFLDVSSLNFGGATSTAVFFEQFQDDRKPLQSVEPPPFS